MSETRDLLLELGTEELPPKALDRLAAALEQGVTEGLQKAQLSYSASQRYATPRRLALIVSDLAALQAERQQQRRGPALSAAFDADGQATKAAQGFARSCGVDVTALETLQTDKGAWLIFNKIEPGQTLQTLLPSIVEDVLAKLPIPRRMRWGASDTEFVRPVHWLVLRFGDETVTASILGINASEHSRGHRFHHPEPIAITSAKDYVLLLHDQGKVMVDFAKRRDSILRQTHTLAESVDGQALIDSDLLDEVTALVEWPVALLGSFEQRFLQVPAEALISTMQDNQKYFPIVDKNNHLLPYFITVSNIESQDIDQVRAGNERVIRPRFSDAEFFWQQDCKRKLNSHQDALKTMVFQQRLGSLYDKCQRVTVLARLIAEQSNSNTTWTERAAALCKCDLLTDMVQEFPELQGTMGRYYAQHDGEPEEVAIALEEQYWPRFAGDKLPQTATGRALALADRLDTLLAIFAIGQPPSGNRDPFALRRAALGVLRVLIECDMDLDLQVLLSQAAQTFTSDINAEQAVTPVFDYMMDRLRAYYEDQGIQSDTFEAVLDRQPTRPLDFDKRIKAVSAFRRLSEAESLAAANKRIRNILKKTKLNTDLAVRYELLTEQAEQQLAQHLEQLAGQVKPLFDSGDYSAAMIQLAVLKQPVDQFFDDVMVMTEDNDLRNNRLALLNELSDLFLAVADFSRLQT